MLWARHRGLDEARSDAPPMPVLHRAVESAEGAKGMTPEKIKRLAELQEMERAHPSRIMLVSEALELEQLRRELAMAPEVADDPSTPFADESKRPNLDGTDWNDMNKA